MNINRYGNEIVTLIDLSGDDEYSNIQEPQGVQIIHDPLGIGSRTVQNALDIDSAIMGPYEALTRLIHSIRAIIPAAVDQMGSDYYGPCIASRRVADDYYHRRGPYRTAGSVLGHLTDGQFSTQGIYPREAMCDWVRDVDKYVGLHVNRIVSMGRSRITRALVERLCVLHDGAEGFATIGTPAEREEWENLFHFVKRKSVMARMDIIHPSRVLHEFYHYFTQDRHGGVYTPSAKTIHRRVKIIVETSNRNDDLIRRVYIDPVALEYDAYEGVSYSIDTRVIPEKELARVYRFIIELITGDVIDIDEIPADDENYSKSRKAYKQSFEYQARQKNTVENLAFGPVVTQSSNYLAFLKKRDSLKSDIDRRIDPIGSPMKELIGEGLDQLNAIYENMLDSHKAIDHREETLRLAEEADAAAKANAKIIPTEDI